MTAHAERTVDESVPPRPPGKAGIAIDGEFVTADHRGLSPSEWREFRAIVRDASDRPDLANPVSAWQAGEIDWRSDVLPALLYVVRRRKNADYTLEDAERTAWNDDELDRMEREAVEAYYAAHPDEDPRTTDDSEEKPEGEQSLPPA